MGNAVEASSDGDAIVFTAAAGVAVAVEVSGVAAGSAVETFAVAVVVRTDAESLRTALPRLRRRGVAAAVWAPPEFEITTPPPTSTLVCEGDLAGSGVASAADAALADDVDEAAASGPGVTPESVVAVVPTGSAGAGSVVDASPESGLAHAAAGNPTAAPTPSATANAPTRPIAQA